MRDIHCHILYGIDDGAESMEESIKMIQQASAQGYTDLVLTPHFRKINGFTCNNANKKERFEALKREVQKKNIPINIYLGNEISIDEDLVYYLETDMVTSLNGGQYILIELPFKNELKNLNAYIDELTNLGYKIIIAHPERYSYYKNLKVFENMINKGVLFQGNFESLNGRWGNDSKKTLEKMLKRHMIHFLGSDAHHEGSRNYSNMKELIPLLEKLTKDKTMVQELIDDNIGKVIQNKDIKAYPIRHGWLL